ncbi:hypothetical protein [Arcticibacter sp. MXS-1]|uniref:hypothetical protein n=1 Tax=Arcticibacter sp. MXS-1 TaxID=3341726 RepID=UPI0035A8E8E4
MGQQLNGYTEYNSCTLNTAADVMQGCTQLDRFILQYQFLSSTSRWSLKVKANTNFTNGSTSIPAQYVSIQFSRVSSGGPSASEMGVSTAPVSLSTSYKNLIYQSPAPLGGGSNTYTEQRFNMIVQGGAHLLVPPGTYKATLTFAVYNRYNRIVASKDLEASFIINYSNSCQSVTLYSSNYGSQIQFNSYNELMAGATSPQYVKLSLQANSASCSGWSLKVRAQGNFTNGSSQVPPQYVSLRFNKISSGAPSAGAIGISSNQVPLSTSDVTLIDHSQAPFQPGVTCEQLFDMIIQGGTHLILPASGPYTTTLVFSLVNSDGMVVATSTMPATFQIYANSNGYTLQLQNTADQVVLNFGTTSDIINGVTVNKLKGLRIRGYSAYQVIAKTTTSTLSSPLTGEALPVSVIRLTATAPAAYSRIVCGSYKLSASDQVLITNPYWDYTYYDVVYDLKYNTDPMDKLLTTVSPGTYSTSVVFVVIPK